MFFAVGTLDIFIAHCWTYDEEWIEFVAVLDEVLGTKWRNWSLPWHDPGLDHFTEKGRAQLIEMLTGQITSASHVFLLAGLLTQVGERRTSWIAAQIDLAAAAGKPIIGVRPKGNKPRKSIFQFWRASDDVFPAPFARRVAATIEFTPKAVRLQLGLTRAAAE